MLTFVILAGFAAIVGVLTDAAGAGAVQQRGRVGRGPAPAELQLQAELGDGLLTNCNQTVRLTDYASAEHAQIRIFDEAGELLCTQDQVKLKGTKALPASAATSRSRSSPARSRRSSATGWWSGELGVQPSGEVDAALRPAAVRRRPHARQVQFFLILGVLGGTVLALLAGLATAQRAMRPIAELTEAAREIERTRDPSRRLPHPEADDEVAELARTLEGMLAALDAARADTEAMLDRQREFVADASHELRTPLTSVLANLELLAEELEGEQAETAQAALRSTRRMRRLVGDLLLLARADAKRVPAAARHGRPRRTC